MDDTKLTWWGYLHESGTVQVKRFFDQQDIDEALESPFVLRVFGPFEATDRDDAIKHIKQHMEK